MNEDEVEKALIFCRYLAFISLAVLTRRGLLEEDVLDETIDTLHQDLYGTAVSDFSLAEFNRQYGNERP